MNGMDPVILFGIALALVMTFVNGLNDASHAIATVVATRALSPSKAVFLTGICNMVGPFIFTTAVADTIGTGIVTAAGLTPGSIIVAMLVTTIFVLIATHAGIPISSSHALVGGLLGAGIAAAGLSAILLPAPAILVSTVIYGLIGAAAGAVVLCLIAVLFKGDCRLGIAVGAVCGAAITLPLLMILGVLKLTGLLAIVLFIFLSPVIGIIAAFVFDVIISHLFRYSRQNRMKRIFTPLHVLACLFQAAGHGANDGMAKVGVITALLLSAGVLSSFAVPGWVILTCAIAIGLGTCFGGWQVVDKMAKKITKIRPYQGFAAATAGSATLAMVTSYGVPVSSTHVISGAIIGVGVTRGKNAVQWDVVREMMMAWVITIPLAAACAWCGYLLLVVFHVVLL
jgi:PiT family inorganic phosphate transporter